MRNRIALSLCLAGACPLAWAGDDGAARAQRLELEARAMQAAAGRAMADPINAGGFGVLNSANGLVLAAFPINSPSATLATLSGALVWGTSMGVDNAAGQKGALGVDPGSSGFVQVHNSTNTATVMMDGNRGLVTFNGDVAEAFPSALAASGVAPGSLMSIDPERPGSVRLATRPYDRLVVGVVSGARDYRPGLTLRGLAEIQGLPLTLTGTTYCLASNANGPIRAGDLLTTSSVPGHAMRATDAGRSRGAIVGKAMEALESSQGLILILANLQ